MKTPRTVHGRMREEKLAGFDDVAPRLADAPDHSKAPRWQATEDVGEGVVRQSSYFRCHLP